MKLIAWSYQAKTQAIQSGSSDDEKPAHKHGWWSWPWHRWAIKAWRNKIFNGTGLWTVAVSPSPRLTVSRSHGPSLPGDRRDVVSPYHRMSVSLYPSLPFSTLPFSTLLYRGPVQRVMIWWYDRWSITLESRSGSDADANHHLRFNGSIEHRPIKAVQHRQFRSPRPRLRSWSCTCPAKIETSCLFWHSIIYDQLTNWPWTEPGIRCFRYFSSFSSFRYFRYFRYLSAWGWTWTWGWGCNCVPRPVESVWLWLWYRLYHHSERGRDCWGPMPHASCLLGVEA